MSKAIHYKRGPKAVACGANTRRGGDNLEANDDLTEVTCKACLRDHVAAEQDERDSMTGPQRLSTYAMRRGQQRGAGRLRPLDE